MPFILVLLAGVLIGADTGLLMRVRVTERTPSAVTHSPTLSVASALVSGIALAETCLLALLEHVPEFAGYVAGPLLAIYGVVRFARGVSEHRWRPVRVDGKKPAEPDGPAASDTPFRQLLGLGIRMGLLLAAAGVRTVSTLTLSIVTAIALATAAPDALRSLSSPRVPLGTVVKTATGALLCAIGVGTEVEQLSQGTVPAFEIALPLAVLAWGACAVAIWRSPNS